jgi:hypothetical protein
MRNQFSHVIARGSKCGCHIATVSGLLNGDFPHDWRQISGKQKIVPLTLIFPLFHISTRKKSIYLMMFE